MSRASVLVVAPIASHPPDQGNSARICAQADELKRRGVELDYFYYGMEGMREDQFEMMSRYWRRFFFLQSTALAPPTLPCTWGLDDWCSDHLCEQVAAIAKKHHYDAVIVNYVWMSKVLDAVTGCVKVLDTHDLFGDRNKVAESANLEPRWFFTTVDEENRGFSRADVVIGIQECESEKIAARHSGRTITVGHPMGPQFLLQRKPKPATFTFGYIGSANPFNLASIAALDKAIASLEFTWALAGTITKRDLELSSHPYRMGMVEKLSDFYDNVECVLNPMVGGTGLKIKTIEALAYGRPIIGTRDAFEGIETNHSFHQLSSIDDFTFAMRDYQSSNIVRQELQRQSFRVFANYIAGVSREYDELADIICSETNDVRLSPH